MASSAINELVLNRGDTGLGFKIRGGTDMPYVPGHSGIFITHMDETGAASLDGRLKVGDRVLEVNGKSIEKVSHNDAVQTFITAGQSVHMKVQPGAGAALLDTNCVPAEPTDHFCTSKNRRIVMVTVGVIAVLSISLLCYMKARKQA